MSQDPDPSVPPSDAELRELIKNATGGYRTTDFSGVIKFQDGTTLCHGDDHDVTWKSEADQAFVTRVTPYVLHITMNERDRLSLITRAYRILLSKHGIDPNGIIAIMRETSFQHPDP
jgi:hypothetical protein